MKQVRIRETTYVTCYDGEVDTTKVVQVLWHKYRGEYGANCWEAWGKDESPQRAAELLTQLELQPIIMDPVTIKRHRHLGEYGSANTHRCDALD